MGKLKQKKNSLPKAGWILYALLLLSFCAVQNPFVSLAWAEETEEEIGISVGELRSIAVDSLQRVAVGDPAIADVNVLSKDEVLLIAKSVGLTQVIIWDKSGKRTIPVKVTKVDIANQVKQLKRILRALNIPGIEVRVEQDKVFVLGEVRRDADLESIEKAIKPFETVTSLVKVRQVQLLVQINVDVLEVAKTALDKLGVDWSDSIRFTETAPARGSLWKLWRTGEWNREGMVATLNALIEEGKVRSLANPSLVTLSGKEAQILVGGEIPIVMVETEGRTSLEWKPYGVILNIKPTVIQKDQINTSIKAEVSDLDWANAIEYQGINVPAMTKRTTETELYLQNNDTLIIAGLIKNEDAKNLERLPFLSNIPVLGTLFKSAQFTKDQTELVIAVTPKIINQELMQEEEEKLSDSLQLEEEEQNKLEMLRKLEEQVKQKEQQARAKTQELQILNEQEKEKIRKFDEIIATLAQEKARTQQHLEELKKQQSLAKQEKEKIEQEKKRLTSYRQAEESKLQKFEQIKKLQQEIRTLIQQTQVQPSLLLPEEFQDEEEEELLMDESQGKEEERQEVLDEELARLKALKEALIKEAEEKQRAEQKTQGLTTTKPLPREQKKRKEVIKTLQEIEIEEENPDEEEN